MANSRRSPPNDNLVATVEGELRHVVGVHDRLLVGLSGGIDSVVLLDVLRRLTGRLRIRLAALHVNHQISPAARRWERFCRSVCSEQSIPFRAARVQIARGESLEAAARAARYAALLAQPADYVVLAHHQDDQVETVLLQLLRGAGVKGLAAMPAVRRGARGEGREARILRPLLGATRSEIECYARRRKLAWVEDESNQDIRLSRNFLRHELFPAIGRRFPAYRATLARSARHLGEAAQLVDELAAIDAGELAREGVLDLAVLQRLSEVRARNVLRWYLGLKGLIMPSTERLEELLRQVVGAAPDARVEVELDRHRLYRWRGGLHVVPSRPHVPPHFARAWGRERSLKLPEFGGVLHMPKVRGSGVSLAKLKGHAVVVRARRGGERLRLVCERPRRTLKNLLQEASVPPWERECLPLLYCGEQLVWAAGIGIDCAYQAAPGEAAVNPRWKPDSIMAACVDC